MVTSDECQCLFRRFNFPIDLNEVGTYMKTREYIMGSDGYKQIFRYELYMISKLNDE